MRNCKKRPLNDVYKGKVLVATTKIKDLRCRFMDERGYGPSSTSMGEWRDYLKDQARGWTLKGETLTYRVKGGYLRVYGDK